MSFFNFVLFWGFLIYLVLKRKELPCKIKAAKN